MQGKRIRGGGTRSREKSEERPLLQLWQIIPNLVAHPLAHPEAAKEIGATADVAQQTHVAGSGVVRLSVWRWIEPAFSTLMPTSLA